MTWLFLDRYNTVILLVFKTLLVHTSIRTVAKKQAAHTSQTGTKHHGNNGCFLSLCLRCVATQRYKRHILLYRRLKCGCTAAVY